jgi:hypothetical protein
MTNSTNKTALIRSQNDIFSDLDKYELIEPYTRFTPLGQISAIEIQPVKDYGDYSEPCEIGMEDFWSVYVRYVPQRNNGFGGVDCVADCSNFTGAEKLADLLAGLLGVEVVQS